MVSRIILLFILIACEKSISPTSTFENTFKLVNRMEVNDTIGLTKYVASSAFINNNEFYISDMRARKIFHINFTSEKVQVWGRNGIADWEYMMPVGLWLKDDTLAYSDVVGAQIEFVTLSGNFVRKQRVNGGGSVYSPVGKISYYPSLSISSKYLKDTNGNSYFDVPNVLRNLKKAFGAPGIFNIADTIYFMSHSENKIFQMNIKDKIKKITKLKGFENQKNWDSIKERSYDPKVALRMVENERLFKKFTYYLSHNKIVFVILSNYENEESLSFFNQDKIIIKHVPIVGKKFIGNFGTKFLFLIETEEGIFSFELYDLIT